MSIWNQHFPPLNGEPATRAQEAFLEERLERMSPKEWRQLKVAVHQTQPMDHVDAIDMTFNLDHFGFHYPAGDYASLGKYLAKYEHHIVNEDILRAIDYEGLGRQYAEQHHGEFVDGAYISYVPNPTVMVHACDPETGAPPPDRGYSVKLLLAGPTGQQGWLRLPDYEEAEGRPDEIRAALDAVYADSLAECNVVQAMPVFPRLGNLMEQYDSIEKLVEEANNLGYALDEQNQGQPFFLQTLEAAMEHEDCGSLGMALDILENLHCYEFVPGDEETLRKMGQEVIENLGVSLDDSIMAHIDFADIVRRELESQGMRRTGAGYFQRNDNTFQRNHSIPKTQPLKLYYAPKVTCWVTEDEPDTGLREYEETIPNDVALRASRQITEALERGFSPEERERGLMSYFWGGKNVGTKVYSAFPRVEEIGGQLWGVADCQVKAPLTGEEMTELKDFLSSQMSDGFGEGFEQRGISCEFGEIFVSFWSCGKDWKIYEEHEMETLYQSVTQTEPELAMEQQI